ncbi:MAG: ribonuclease E/G, partial [Gammaproteobacteria bacterium]|nr:ribonuclease E/G [Gammaproteobacteria bacterium]
MRRQIIISASSRETRVALLEDKRLVELMLDRPDQGRLVGDVFLGRVEAVLPGIQAAFVDIGVEKAGFLHVSDVVHQDGEPSENGRDGQNTPIQKLLNKGDRVTVQVTKEPIGTKGPRLTAQVSLAGRFLVYMPFSSRVGVSRKIEDRRQRSRLRALARRVVPADSGGVIVRTVGEEATEKRFAREFETLRGSWLEIQRTAKAAAEPGVVRREARLISGVIRDLFSDKFDSLTVDSPVIFREIEGYVQ